MGKFILRSKAVFTGLEDFPRPAAIAVVDKKIQAVLPWDFQRDKDYEDRHLYDHRNTDHGHGHRFLYNISCKWVISGSRS